MQSPIFDPEIPGRTNVVQFISDLFIKDSLWIEWLYKMPVMYNSIK